MAGPYVPCKKNGAGGYIFYTSLVSQANTKIMQASPTLAAGDFKVSIDGGALANLGTLPTNTPAASTMVKITLSQAEINGDNITIVCSDAAGAEWCDQTINIPTSTRQIDDLAYPATSGRSMVVDAAGLVDANAVKLGPTGAGTAQTARDVGASVLLSAGFGTGQLDFTAGVLNVNATEWAGGFTSFDGGSGLPNVRVTTNADKTGYALTAGERNSTADAFLARSLGTEGYAAKGAVPTVQQAMFMLLQNMQEMSISSTTLTLKKLDGSTTAMTFTLDSATAPTSRTRAT